MNISIGNDHAGVELKQNILKELQEHKVKNYGTNSSESVDYPDFIHPVAKDVEINKADIGIIICGSGNGASMTANKYKNVRSAIAWNKETCALARKHNNANILSIPARFIKKEDALEIVRIFLETEFEGGRHKKRINKINKCL